MIRPKPDVPERTPVLTFPTPEGQADLLFYESRDGDLPKNKSWKYGDPHPDRAKFPHHELVHVVEGDGGWQRWYYAADRENQHLYNWQLTNTTDWPQLTQTFLVRRSDYTLLDTAPTTDLPPTFKGKYVWTFMGEEAREAGEVERGLFVVLTRSWQDTREARQTHTLDNDTGELSTSERRMVPESTLASKIDSSGRFTEVTPFSTLVSVATTRQASGLAGQANFGKAARTIPLTDNYPWPPILNTIDIAPVLSNPGDFSSDVTGYNWRPIWYSEGYNGPCRGELRETWYLKQPTSGGDANWKMGAAWAPSTVYVVASGVIPASYVSYNGESYKCVRAHTSGPSFVASDETGPIWIVVRPLLPTETPMLTRSIEFHGRDLTISNLPRCLHPQMTIQDTQFYGSYAATTPRFWPTTVLARVRVSPDQGGWLVQEWWYYSPDLSGLTPGLILEVVTVGSRSFKLQWTPQLDNSTIDPMKLDVCRRADFKSGFLPGYKGMDITPPNSSTPLQIDVLDAPRGVNLYCRVRREGYVFDTSNTVLVSCEPMAELDVTVDDVAVSRPTTLPLSNIVQGTGRVLTVKLTNSGLLTLDNLVATKSGTNASDVTVGTLPTSLAPGESGTFTITVNPSTLVESSVTVSLASSAIEDTPWAFNLTYTGVVPEINLTVRGSSIASGSTVYVGNGGDGTGAVPTGEEISTAITVQNTGTGQLDLAATLLPTVAGEFRLTNVPNNVAPGGNNTLNVIFAPTAGGERTATLSIANNDLTGGESPYVLNLSGTGNAVGEIEIHDPDGYLLADASGVFDFGTVGTSMGDERLKTFTIYNRGAGPLTGLAVSKSGPQAAEFLIGALGATTLAAGASTTFSVTADLINHPLSKLATISVASSDSNENPSTFDVVAIAGNDADIVVQYPAGTTLVDGVSSISFGGTLVAGGSNSLSLTIKNIGHSLLTSLAASITGTHAAEFTLSSLVATLATDISTTLTVTFNPAAYGLRSAVLSITSNDPDENPFTIALSGTGTIANGLATYQQASVVVGQADFDDQAFAASTSVTPMPAGCAVNSSGRLAICDPLAQVVRIWNSVPNSNGAACDITLGEAGVFGTSATRFAGPYGVAWFGNDLFVCDSSNHRVLRFTNPSTNGQAADLVIGQTTFSGGGSNKGTTTTNRSGLNFPLACAIYVGKLMVCDSDNNRVLIWDTIPTTNGANATFVVGQSSFTSSVTGTAANRFYSPEGICVSPTTGRMYVADRVNGRVCVWSAVPNTSNSSATGLLGLPAFGNVIPGADSTLITQPQGVAVSNAGFVAVSNLSYVKVWYEEPTLSPSGYGPPAHVILGQTGFAQDTHQEWGNSMGPDSRGFQSPRGVQWDGNDLIVSDPEGKRTLIFKP